MIIIDLSLFIYLKTLTNQKYDKINKDVRKEIYLQKKTAKIL